LFYGFTGPGGTSVLCKTLPSGHRTGPRCNAENFIKPDCIGPSARPHRLSARGDARRTQTEKEKKETLTGEKEEKKKLKEEKGKKEMAKPQVNEGRQVNPVLPQAQNTPWYLGGAKHSLGKPRGSFFHALYAGAAHGPLPWRYALETQPRRSHFSG